MDGKKWFKEEAKFGLMMHFGLYSNERGVNYLLNVGPDHLGRIPAPAVDILKEVGKRSK